MDLLGYFLHVSRNFQIFHEKLELDLREDGTAINR